MQLDVATELRNCLKSFHYWSQYLKIEHDGKIMPFVRNVAQMAIGKALEGHQFVKILKARRLGSSTEIAAEFLYAAMYTPHVRVLVLAHSDKAVRHIFHIYKTFYNMLPSFLKTPLVGSGSRERIEFRFELEDGSEASSFIEVMTANSESARGFGYTHIHGSETSRWDDLGVSAASIFSTAYDNAQIVVETTANGINQFHDFWTQENGYFPLFLSWTDDMRCRRKHAVKGDLTEDEVEYLRSHVLTPEQTNYFLWYKRTKSSNSITVFKQEMPTTAEEAFLATGQPFFGFAYDAPICSVITDFGWKTFVELKKTGVYLMGVDTASGSSLGDFSATCVLEVLDVDKHIRLDQVATYYAHAAPKAFGREMLEFARQWSPLVVIENNNYGLAVIEDFIAGAYPYLYQKQEFDHIKQIWTGEIGFGTRSGTRMTALSRLYDFVFNKRLIIRDARLGYEMKRFKYNDRGKPEHEKNYHDDLIFATTMALMGLDQVQHHAEEVKQKSKPKTQIEILAWEAQTGRMWREAKAEFVDDDDLELVPPAGLSSSIRDFFYHQ